MPPCSTKANNCRVEDEADVGYRLNERSDVSPAMEDSAARRMGAVTTILPTCHMVILEEPAKVAAVIDEAARTALTNLGSQ
jgi:hypothetical protein